MTKIEKLTPAQVARFGEFRDKWLAHGLSTATADRVRAEAGVRLAYEVAGLKAPTIFIWLDSPHAGAIGAALLANGSKFGAQVWDQVGDQVGAQVGDQVGAQVGDQVWDQVRDQVWDQVRAQVRAQVGAQVGDQVWDQVGAQVGDQVWDQVWDQVGAQVGDQVRAQVWDQVGDQVNRAAYGQHDANWLAFYEFFGSVTGLTCVNPLRGMNEIAQSCGWWWPFERAVILTERPSEIHRDDANRLHGEKRPALLYRDGFAIWSWHGVRVPEAWIMGKPPTAAEALTWPNMEQRRAACELVGWHNILRELKAKTIQKDADPEVGELLEVNIPDIGKERFLRVRCGTGREFAIPVPPTMRSALEANAWTYGVDPVDYKPEVRT